MFVVNAVDDGLQGACCLFPPFALQIGSGAFLDSYDGIPLSRICGIMVSYRTILPSTFIIFIFSLLIFSFSLCLVGISIKSGLVDMASLNRPTLSSRKPIGSPIDTH
jgi:hypothetical protein